MYIIVIKQELLHNHTHTGLTTGNFFGGLSTLCGDTNLVIQHLVKDSWNEFKDWYSSYKKKKLINTDNEKVRPEVKVEKGRYYIGNIEAVKIDSSISEEDKARLNNYLVQIFDALKNGYEPAIVPVYDKKEVALLPRLRDKYRQGR